MEETIGLNSDITYEGPEYENRREDGNPLIDLDEITVPPKPSWTKRKEKFKRDLAEIFDDDLGPSRPKRIDLFCRRNNSEGYERQTQIHNRQV